jgi:glycosyltransferase involved in cell wall biosynthesis
MENSVIITVYNKLQHLRNAMMSLCSQSVLPDELILADDGSSEDIVGGIADLVRECRFPVTFVQQADIGFRASKNRNNGAKQAKGNYLVYFDQDLIYTRNYLEGILTNKRSKHFYVGYPIWLTEEQSRNVTPDVIRSCNFQSVASEEQRQFIARQYTKEWLYTVLNAWGLRKYGPSLRSCCFGVYKKDLISVNGFDESFKYWGYEDDDLGNRLYAAGIKGFNPLKTEFPMHCYHAFTTRADSGKSLNRDYFLSRKREINRKNFRCEYGYDTPMDDDTFTVTALN